MHEYDRDDSGRIEFRDFMEISTPPPLTPPNSSLIVNNKYANRDPEEEIMKAFDLFDDDGTGKISLPNLRRIARELGENLTDDELQAMIDEFDKDQDGKINREEFLAIMSQTSIY